MVAGERCIGAKVFLTALTAVPGQPALAFIGLKEQQEQSLLGSIVILGLLVVMLARGGIGRGVL